MGGEWMNGWWMGEWVKMGGVFGMGECRWGMI